MGLISASELAALSAAPDAHLAVRVVDARWYLLRPGGGRRAYEEGHLPGAIFLDLDADLSAPVGPGRHPLPDPAVFAARLGALGIGDRHLIVAYDDTGGTVAARLWWMLDALGHARTAVLDGGMAAWLSAHQPLTREATVHPPTQLHLAPTWPRTIDREELRQRLGTLVLLDARAGERYRGEVEPIDPAAGHIPTAHSAPATDNLDAEGRLLSPGVLRARFEALGAGLATVVSCGSGTNACQLALAMRVAGLPDPLLYPGSFSDWSRAGLPVATGPEPGRPPA